MLISEQRIIEILSNYSGQSPLRREDLLAQLRTFSENITDREMREIYASNPLVLSNCKGLYLAQTMEEVTQFYKQERKRGISILVRARRARRAFIEAHKAKEAPISYKYEENGQISFV
jgi:hypothetical protein